MKWLVRFAIFGCLVGLVAAGVGPARAYWKERNRPKFRQAEVTKGQVVSVVNSTGTVKPVRSVAVGSFVSGPVAELFVDFNAEVKKDDLLAKIDTRIYDASVARDRAALVTRKAEVDRVTADLQRAENDERRSKALRAESKDFISDTEMDQFRFNRLSLAAQLKVAEAAVDQADATLKASEANLDYAEIRSPVDGIVIDRKVDPGQTIAASFQTPELFVVAPDLRKEVHVFANVDEADIGLIAGAQTTGRPVQFTVDAYPNDLFEGRIHQIRKSSTTTQNVVTYPVVVSAANPDLKLLPGMTANLSFQIDEKKDVLRVPNAALRFYPQREHVREEDRKLLDGAKEEDEQSAASEPALPADETVAENRKRNRRHVWVIDGDFLKAIEIVTGLSDHAHTELVSGSLKEGQKLVTGLEPKTP